ncbi:40S ribosomal protein S4 [Gigaspora margarita]|uniref:40S ribosomal protein S4 n=1 Tax=Gigaspora margarita TaxID=4874 RepID=A0A8H3X4X1_GIGMA|nr:40S ribosomal protein S4 [Gigaspora margarita]
MPPSHWILNKHTGTYNNKKTPRPSSGPHKLRECLPLVIFLRNSLKYALIKKEIQSILMQCLVKVDEKNSENFHLIYDTKGWFTIHKITTDEATYKLTKVKRVQFGAKGIPYLVTHDGHTIYYPDPIIKVNDTVRLDLETGKIIELIKFEVRNIAMITGGHNMTCWSSNSS